MPPGQDTLVRGLKAVAMHFGRSLRQVQRWVRVPDFPQMITGRRWDLVQIQTWLDARDGKPVPPSRGSDPRQSELSSGPEKRLEESLTRGKEAEEARLKKLTADIKEEELKKLRREVVALAELEALLAARALAYRTGLVTLRRILPPKLAAALGLPPESLRVMEAIITEVAAEILNNVLRPLTLADGQVVVWGKDIDVAN